MCDMIYAKYAKRRGTCRTETEGFSTPAQAIKPSVRWQLSSPREQGFPACRTSKSVHRKDFDGSPAPPSLGFKSSQIQKSTPKMGCYFVAEKEGFSRPRRQPSPPRDDSRPHSEGKVFLLVARQNPFTERILTAPPRRRRSGSNPLKYKKAPRKWGAFLWRRRRDLNPRAGYPAYTLSRGASSAS